MKIGIQNKIEAATKEVAHSLDEMQELFSELQGSYAVCVTFGLHDFHRTVDNLGHLILDFLVNLHFIREKKSFSFFLEEEPLFWTTFEGDVVRASYYLGTGFSDPQIQHEKYEAVTAYLSGFCDGLITAASRGRPDLREAFLRSADEDIRSENRAMFVSPGRG
jgi:hypothetical protein